MRVVALLACIIAAAGTQAQAVPAKATGGWIFHQRSAYAGQQEVYVSADRAMLRNELVTAILIPAQDKAVLYNVRNRSYYELPLSEWKSRLTGDLRKEFGDRYIGPQAAGSIAGFPVNHYRIEGMRNGRQVLCGEVWVAPDTGIPPPVLAAICRTIDLPKKFGMVMKLVRHNERDKPVRAVETIKVERKTLEASLFTVPAGFKKVEDEVALFLDEDSEDLSDLLGGSGTPETRPAAGRTGGSGSRTASSAPDGPVQTKDSRRPVR